MMSRAQLARDAGWGWVLRNLDYFDFTAAHETADQVQLLKPFGELLLIASTVESSQETRSILDHCWGLVSKDRLVSNLLMARPGSLELTAIAASFGRAGYPIGEFRAQIVGLLQNREVWASHLPLWRRLAIVHSLEVLGLRDWPDAPPRGTFLSDKPPPWVVSDEMAYAMTHEIFYCTDFGRRRERWISPLVFEYLGFVLPLWARIYLRKRNFDLVGELLACAGYLGIGLAPQVFDALLDHQQPDGSFPGPEGAGSGLPRGQGGEDIVSKYHTTLVALMAISSREAMGTAQLGHADLLPGRGEPMPGVASSGVAPQIRPCASC